MQQLFGVLLSDYFNCRIHLGHFSPVALFNCFELFMFDLIATNYYIVVLRTSNISATKYNSHAVFIMAIPIKHLTIFELTLISEYGEMLLKCTWSFH